MHTSPLTGHERYSECSAEGEIILVYRALCKEFEYSFHLMFHETENDMNSFKLDKIGKESNYGIVPCPLGS